MFALQLTLFYACTLDIVHFFHFTFTTSNTCCVLLGISYNSSLSNMSIWRNY